MNTTQSVGNGQHPPEHPRPFFYVQPPPPPPPPPTHFPYQWHIQNMYNPYGFFPSSGYGYGYPFLPPNPYMEIPGYIVPQAQLYPADYRRLLTPHIPPTMAYHARRFRYQQNTLHREMMSSEVQTEPCSVMRDSENSRSTDTEQGAGSDSGLGGRAAQACNSGTNSQCPSARQEGREDELGTSKTRMTTPRSYLFQKEEVRIECQDMPSALKIIRSRETTAEPRPSRPDDLVHCDVWSVSSAEGVIPLYSSSVHEVGVLHNSICPEQNEVQCTPTFPDILLLGTSQSDSLPGVCDQPRRALCDNPEKDSKMIMKENTTYGKGIQRNSGVKEICLVKNLKNVRFKILRLPFESIHTREGQKQSESVWSVETLMPYYPTADWLTEKGTGSDSEHFSKRLSLEKVPENRMSSTVPDSPMQCSRRKCCKILKLPFVTHLESQRDESQWSVESIAPYVPSSCWLADFGNIYYYSKLPLTKEACSMPLRTDPKGELPVDQDGSGCPIASHASVASCTSKKKRCLHVGETDIKTCMEDKASSHILHETGKISTEKNMKRNCAQCLSKLYLHSCQRVKAIKDVNMGKKVLHSAHALSKLTCTACKNVAAKEARKSISPVMSTEEEEEMDENSVDEEDSNNEKRSCRSCKMNGRKREAQLKGQSELCTKLPAQKKMEKNSCRETGCTVCHKVQGQSHPDLVMECYEEHASRPDAGSYKELYQKTYQQKSQMHKPQARPPRKRGQYWPMNQRPGRNYYDGMDESFHRPSRGRGKRRGTRY
ncbi:bucky ball-like [Polypterus senegalus]|uniref:bucky ball-like n=1 Tax=Polypterus senegalus TaxID=55291 RepID=UPI001963BC33|nr:bucky ball-like [Polypterus senegalus]